MEMPDAVKNDARGTSSHFYHQRVSIPLGHEKRTSSSQSIISTISRGGPSIHTFQVKVKPLHLKIPRGVDEWTQNPVVGNRAFHPKEPLKSSSSASTYERSDLRISKTSSHPSGKKRSPLWNIRKFLSTNKSLFVVSSVCLVTGSLILIMVSLADVSVVSGQLLNSARGVGLTFIGMAIFILLLSLFIFCITTSPSFSSTKKKKGDMKPSRRKERRIPFQNVNPP